MAAQLRMADEKLFTIEDLIGQVRARMCTRGLATNPPVRRPFPKSAAPVPADAMTNSSLSRE